MNNCTFVGRLGADAQIKDLEGGKKVLSFSIAVDDGKDRPPVWLDCSRWSEKNAVAEYMKKGTQVAVSGNVGIRKWETGATLTLRVTDIRLLGGSKEEYSAQPTASNPIHQPAPIEPIDDLSF